MRSTVTLPLAKLELKIGCPVMVAKELDAANECMAAEDYLQ